MIFQTKRLVLRELTPDDYSDLCLILQDIETMYAYEHAFSDREVHQWLQKQLKNYDTYGFGLWAVIRKDDKKLVGQCGITMQDWEGRQVPEIGYLFQKSVWKKGYAIEAARGCRQYAFETLGIQEIYSIIRDNNFSSMNVAIRNGMLVRGRFTKHYYGIDMPHLVFSVQKNNQC